MPGCKDAIECKLFGIGSESYVVGSHEFYMGYAMTRNKMLCIDMGHFHPMESIADKISSILAFSDELLLHVSRGVRWDSDHVVIFSDDLCALAQEIVRGNAVERIHYALDFFDASINRIGAWVIGTRAFQKALLGALLEPADMLQQMERNGDGVARLGLMEDSKTMPLSAVWDHFCLLKDVPTGFSWINEVRAYEQEVLSKRP
jgi:L-rhamnose isomerase